MNCLVISMIPLGFHRQFFLLYTKKLSTGLNRSMFQAIAVGQVPYTAPPRHTFPLLAPFEVVITVETLRGVHD